MYSDRFKWDSVGSYYQQQAQHGNYHGSGSNSSKRRHSNASNSNKSRMDAGIKEEITSIVQRSGVLGVKKEKHERIDQSTTTENPNRPSSSTSSVTLLETQSQPREILLERNPANSLLPAFDHLCDLPPSFQCQKFFTDIQPLDRILARIIRIGVAVLHVELICTLTRFKRNLAFMKGKMIPVAFDRTKRFYQVNDYISTTVMAIAPNSADLELQLDEEEAIFTEQGIPAYSRDFDTTTYDNCHQLNRLRDNPNLALQLGVQINSQYSGLRSLFSKQLHLWTTTDQLRREQIAKLAMTHVIRGAELTRENKCFEAIQCFNKALTVDENCADAYVGRGAACAGMANFAAAILDFERALGLDPLHRNANKYRMEVLMAFGRDLERSSDLEEARSKFQRVLELQPGHQPALEALNRLNQAGKLKQQELVELSDDEDHVEEEKQEGRATKRSNGFERNGNSSRRRSRTNTLTEEEAKRNRQKLNEMEEFIQKLKSSGKK